MWQNLKARHHTYITRSRSCWRWIPTFLASNNNEIFYCTTGMYVSKCYVKIKFLVYGTRMEYDMDDDKWSLSLMSPGRSVATATHVAVVVSPKARSMVMVTWCIHCLLRILKVESTVILRNISERKGRVNLAAWWRWVPSCYWQKSRFAAESTLHSWSWSWKAFCWN